MAWVNDLYNAPSDQIDYEMVRRLVLSAEAADLFSESLTLEVKLKRSGNNIAEAVAALANSDGGLVLVGVAENGATGDQRLVGVPRNTLDSLVSHLQGLLPRAMPDIIPVATPSDTLIIVLRVNAETVLHPVVVAGRTMYRVPGHTVPADRQRIIDLIQRDNSPDAPHIAAPSLPSGDTQFPLWNGKDDGSTATLRVIGGLRLPHRILERPWLDTSARDAAIEELNASALPDRLFHLAPAHPPIAGWHIFDTRSSSMRFRAPAGGKIETDGEIQIDAEARLTLSGRQLALLAGLRWSRTNKDEPAQLGPAGLYRCLVGLVCTVAETCRSVAKAIRADEPADWLAFEGGLEPYSPYSADSVLELSQFGRDDAPSMSAGHFPRALPSGQNVDALDELARNWFTVLLLELGVRDFEGWLSGVTRPTF